MSGEPKKRRRPLRANISVDVAAVVELQSKMATALATILRDVADDEPPEVAARLREIAALFETGLPVE